MICSDPTAVGNIARCFFGVQRAELVNAEVMHLLRQDRLGECLVKTGAISMLTLQDILTKQSALRSKASLEDIKRLVDFATQGAARVSERVDELCRAIAAR